MLSYFCHVFSVVPLGVQATSRILTSESQKLRFSTVTNVLYSAHVACSQASTWAEWAEVVRRQGVSYVDKIHIFEILMTNCSKYLMPSQIGWNFWKVSTPNPQRVITHRFRYLGMNISIEFWLEVLRLSKKLTLIDISISDNVQLWEVK